MTPYAGDAEPPRLTCWRLTTTRVGGGRLSLFFHASTSYPGRPSFQGGRIRWHACLNHVWLLVFSQEASPLQAVLYLCIYIGTYISAYCRNRITTSHAPASTTAFRILIICSGKKGGKSVSPSFSAPGFDIAAGQTGSLHSRDLSGR